VGLFTGVEVSMTLHPAPVGHGILFQRSDLQRAPLLPATSEYVQGTPRCTVIGKGSASVQTVEHLLSALRAYSLDNVLIEITGGEVPIFDGSSQAFVEMIESSGISSQDEPQPVLRLKEPLFWSQNGVHLVALPSDEYRVSYTLHYPHCPVIGTQFYTTEVTPSAFKNEIAFCRTFSIYEEIASMIEKGLVKGGSLDRAVLIKEGRVANPGGLRCANEMVRHKVLDLIGDLALLPPFLAHILAVCSGHTSNNAFAKHFLNTVKVENL
jgi:UDP-3-O-[3-hydroxymyristoyl] N-acetylglucosamine deacetylase